MDYISALTEDLQNLDLWTSNDFVMKSSKRAVSDDSSMRGDQSEPELAGE